ncbi:hypothetical protein IAR50_007591 [Cryptococcus sp. DSM 104548]
MTTWKICSLGLGFSLAELFSYQLTEFVEDVDVGYSEVCNPVIYLAQSNHLFGGKLCTFTSILQNMTPANPLIPQGLTPVRHLGAQFKNTTVRRLFKYRRIPSPSEPSTKILPTQYAFRNGGS